MTRLAFRTLLACYLALFAAGPAVHARGNKAPATVVVQDAANGDILHTTSFAETSNEGVRSSIAVSDGQLFIRVADKLYCVGK